MTVPECFPFYIVSLAGCEATIEQEQTHLCWTLGKLARILQTFIVISASRYVPDNEVELQKLRSTEGEFGFGVSQNQALPSLLPRLSAMWPSHFVLFLISVNCISISFLHLITNLSVNPIRLYIQNICIIQPHPTTSTAATLTQATSISC